MTAIRKYGHVKIHWYMASIEVHYNAYVKNPQAPDGDLIPVPRHKRMNAIVQSPGRNIVAKTLSDVRILVFNRAKEEYKIEHENVSDYVIQNMIYMGHMTENEYFTKYQPKISKGA